MEDEVLISKLLSVEGIVSAFIADDDTFREVCRVESGVTDTSFGMRLENRALEACKSCSRHIILFCDPRFQPPVPDSHIIVMEDVKGRVVGFDVHGNDKERLVDNDDLVWICDDFAIDASAEVSECRMVMLPQETTVLGKKEGVGRAVLLYPAPTTDMFLRRRYGLDIEDPGIASAIMGCDPVRSRPVASSGCRPRC